VGGAITQIGLRDIERRPSGGEIAVVEIEGEGRAEIVADPGYPLITELPAAVVEELSDARDFQPVENVDRPHSEPDMRRNRVAEREVVEHIGHDRIGVPVAADPFDYEVGPNEVAGA